MQTDALINELAARAEPVAEGTVARRLGIVLFIGLIAAMSIQLLTVGPRADLDMAWLAVLAKVSVCVAIAAVWLRYLKSLSAPGQPTKLRSIIAIVTIAAAIPLAAMAAYDFAGLSRCVHQVLMLSIPALLGFQWVLSKSAPTQPMRAGFALGVAAGSIGAFAYALGCQVDTPNDVAFRYGGAILATGLLGALLGKLTLKW
ncbi:MAG: NrsF family protein [Pseudomonadota bacterium]